MATTYLTRTTTAGTPTSSKKNTLSVWLKKSGLGAGTFFNGGTNDQNQNFINFNPNDKIFIQNSTSNSNNLVLVTTQVFRDTSAWYNIILAIDTTQGTASNRVKLYVNGVQITAFDTETYPAVDAEIEWNKSGATIEIGKYPFDSSGSAIYNGSMSHFNFIDGTQELPTVFGETDSTTGEWKIKTSPSVTYGNNGFFILKDGNSVTDQSGNSNNFTVGGGTLTNTEDCPDNVFATLNPLDNYYAGSTFSNGNNTIVSVAGSYTYNTSTIGVASGKFYSEVKVNTSNDNVVGIAGGFSTSDTSKLEDQVNNYGYIGFDGTVMSNGSTLATYGTYTTGDIIGIAVDCTNNKFYVSKNGVFQGSADPSNNTGGLSITAAASVINNVYMFAGGENSGARTVTHNWNFGNGYFGTTAVSSAGTNASGIGIFEYDVPTGYTALSTKGLNL
jgi:hypothetical protein